MKQVISDILSKYVDDFSFVSTTEYKETRSSLQKGDFYDDYSFLDGFKTIITLAVSYPSESLKWGKKGTGLLSRYSYGIDYHIELRKRLKEITIELDELGIKSESSVDTGKVDERWASYLSGLGYLGKNQFLIHKKYGGYIYLATILIDQEIEKEFRILDTCGDCRKCIDACPTNALDGKFYIDRCISETTQSKKEFTDYDIKQLKTMVYGCDICQKVCPKNKGINYTHNSMFEPTGIESVNLIEVLKMSNKEYMNIYKNNASSWKGATVIRRNALCLLLNQGVKDSIPVIRQTLDRYKDISWYNNVALKVISELERK